MRKRAKLTDRDPVLDVLRGSEPAEKTSKAPKKETAQPLSQPAAFDEERRDEESGKVERVKTTFYLDAEDMDLLELEKLRRRRRSPTRKRESDLSGLVREAIRRCYGLENGHSQAPHSKS